MNNFCNLIDKPLTKDIKCIDNAMTTILNLAIKKVQGGRRNISYSQEKLIK